MRALPAFHTAAVAAADERIEEARAEAVASGRCLADIDAVLSEPWKRACVEWFRHRRDMPVTPK